VRTFLEPRRQCKIYADPFQSPPGNQGTISKGSDSVFADNQPVARAGDPATCCNDPTDQDTGHVLASDASLPDESSLPMDRGTEAAATLEVFAGQWAGLEGREVLEQLRLGARTRQYDVDVRAR
jgi:hypothetical protein